MKGNYPWWATWYPRKTVVLQAKSRPSKPTRACLINIFSCPKISEPSFFPQIQGVSCWHFRISFLVMTWNPFFLQCTSLKAAWSTSGSRTLQRLKATNKEVMGNRIPSSWQTFLTWFLEKNGTTFFLWLTHPKANMSQVSSIIFSAIS